MTALCCISAMAEEPMSKQKDKQVLSLSFLAYLAELKQVDGKWVGPMEMQEVAPEDKMHPDLKPLPSDQSKPAARKDSQEEKK